jgi:polysaccharide biosynthesis transport protein
MNEAPARQQVGFEPPEEESQLFHVWRVVRDRWWIVALATLLCVGAALAISLSSDDEYEATARLLFRDSGLSTAVSGTSLSEPSTDPQRDAATNVQLVRSTRVAELVRDKLGLKESPQSLLDDVTIEAEEDSDIVAITASEPNPRLAADVANTFAAQYVRSSKTADRAKVLQGEELLRQRIDSLPPGSTAERAKLEDALRSLLLLEAVQTGNAEVTDSASVPSSPASPKPVRDGILAAIFGLVLGFALALLLDMLDRRIKSVEEFEQRYGLRALTTVPQRAFDASTEAQRLAAAEPYRILRSAVDYRSSWEPIRTLLITSAGPNEGKTTVAVNLARAAAVGGQSVALLEADMRRPGFGQHFEIEDESRGLSTALARNLSPERMLLPTGTDTLHILPSGPLPPNPSELIRGERMGDLFEQLGRTADLLIVDCPPLLPVADAQSLLGREQIDAYIVVARAYQTTRQEIRRARAILDQHEVKPIGLVVCGTKGEADYYAGYRPLVKPEAAEMVGDGTGGPLMPEAPIAKKSRGGARSRSR